MKIFTHIDFPMAVGDRLFIKYPDGRVQRIRVDKVIDHDQIKKRESLAHTETVKVPARIHASSNAMRFTGGWR